MPELFAAIEEIPASAFEPTQRLSSTVGEIGSLVEAIATPQPQLRDYVQPRLICGRAVCRASGGKFGAALQCGMYRRETVDLTEHTLEGRDETSSSFEQRRNTDDRRFSRAWDA
jgi:hypothetical protein